MNIGIIGCGYVGLTTGICLSSIEHKSYLYDIDQKKLNSIKEEKLPFYELGLEELLIENLHKKKLVVSKNLEEFVQNTECCFVCVGTPSNSNGTINLNQIENSVKKIIEVLKYQIAKEYVIIIRSTVVPSTTRNKIMPILTEDMQKRIKVVVVPEFLREGKALVDFMNPDKIVIGTSNNEKNILVNNIFTYFKNKAEFIQTNYETAEMIKYTNNAFLATLISFSNEIANISEEISGIDSFEVMSALIEDKRITTMINGQKIIPGIAEYLAPGCGFGGSCFQKDILNLVYISRQYGLDEVADYWHNVVKINEFQKDRFSQIIIRNIKTSSNQIVSVLGWAFKKDTNDSRESSSISVTSNLLLKELTVKVYDPLIKINQIYQDITTYLEFKNINQKNISKLLQKLTVNDNLNHCLIETDAIAFLTEWDIFLDIEWDKFSKNQHNKSKPKIFDGRGIIDQEHVSSLGYQIYQIGNGDNSIN